MNFNLEFTIATSVSSEIRNPEQTEQENVMIAIKFSDHGMTEKLLHLFNFHKVSPKVMLFCIYKYNKSPVLLLKMTSSYLQVMIYIFLLYHFKVKFKDLKIR